MEIVEMNCSHVPAVAAIEKECFSDPWSEKSIASELENPLSLWFVAMDGNRVCGYVGSQTVLGESDMMNIAVSGDYRRQGIGEQLISRLIRELSKRGSHILCLEVRASNEPAIMLYEKLGFSVVGKRPGYYRHPREDALIMRKEWQL